LRGTVASVLALQPDGHMMPVSLCREVPVPFEVSVFWKIFVAAALASFVAVVLLAWHASQQPKVVVVEVPSACSTR
jgi:hypothetical protein